MNDDSTRPWIDKEPSWREMRLQISRLRRRAIAHPLKVTLVTLLVVGSVVARQARKRETFDATVTFRVAEQTGGGESEGEYQTKARLREYFANGIFTKARLLRLIKTYDLYPDLYRTDPNLAILEFRDDLEIKVYQNYFLKEDWEDTGKPRTARIRIRLRYIDAELALKVARALGALVKEHEAMIRRALAKEAAQRATTLLTTIKDRMEYLEARQAEKLLELQTISGLDLSQLRLNMVNRQIDKLERQRRKDPDDAELKEALNRARDSRRMLQRLAAQPGAAKPPSDTPLDSYYAGRLRVELDEISAELEKLRQTEEQAELTKIEQDLRAALERQRMLLRFEAVDWGKAPAPLLSRTTRLTLLGIGLLLFLWPLMGLGVAAFDPRVHDLADVRHLKLVPLGQVPRFRGSNLGTLRSRTRSSGHRRRLARLTRFEG